MTEPETPPPGVSIALLRNPLQPARRELFEAEPGAFLIDWLTEHFPKGFGGGITLGRNGREIEIAEADFMMEDGDCITIVVHPGGHIELGVLIVQAIVGAIIGGITTLVFNLIFGKPKGTTAAGIPAPDPIYSIAGAQNAARLGDPVPALYGRMLTTPDFASQPYVFFDGNQQYLDQILCIGWGEYELHDLRVGTTPVSALESNAVQFWLIDGRSHLQTMGRIEAALGVMENVVSSPEVADQELSGVPTGDVIEIAEPTAKFVYPNQIQLLASEPPIGYNWALVSGTYGNNRQFGIAAVNFSGGHWSIVSDSNNIFAEAANANTVLRYLRTPPDMAVGPFVTSKPGAAGNRIMLDFVWPNGLYSVDEKTGKLNASSVFFTIAYQQIDDAGAALGPYVNYDTYVSRATNTPVRETISIDVAPGRYRVLVNRSSPPPASAQEVNSFVWTGLKFRLLNTAHRVYDDVTLLVVRIRATNGIAANASSRITADVTRKLPALGDPAASLRASRDPAEAFADIFTNPIYGGKRPFSELDLAELARLQAHWAGEAHFDGGFAQKSTIWEALTLSVQTAAAAPLPLGQLMSIAQDGVKALRTQLFSDANIKAGTLAIGYSFDKPGDHDGVRVEYRDPSTWNPAYQLYPPTAIDPDAVTLFGSADAGQAFGFAKMLWQKQQGQRKTAQFETELEGLIPRLGDRIAIAVSLPRWARGGVVVAVNGLTLTIDEPIEWPDNWAALGYFVMLRNQYGTPSDPIAISPGFDDNEIILAAAPPFALFGTGTQEPTHYGLGTASQSVADFTIANIEHRGGAAVAIDAINYNPAVFAATLPWLERPI